MTKLISDIFKHNTYHITDNVAQRKKNTNATSVGYKETMKNLCTQTLGGINGGGNKRVREQETE
jgi:hypothetical protein